MDTPRLTLRRLAFLVAAAYAPTVLANTAARVEFATSEPVIVAANGSERPARKGELIAAGDRILTRGGRAQLTFTDGGFVSLQPNTDFGVTEYNFKGSNDGSEKSVLSLFKGALRTVTGLIGRNKRDAYLMHTPTATIGIRGTGGRIEVNERGTLVAGTSGTWFMSTLGGSIDIPAGTGGFAGTDRNQPPQPVASGPNISPAALPQPPGFVAPEQVNASGSSSVVAGSGSMADGSGYAFIPNFNAGPTNPVGSTATFNNGITLRSYSDSVYTQSQGTTQIVEAGNDGIIGWGRWTNGTATLANTPTPIAADQGLHYIVGVPTAVMPTAGGGNYTMIGHTNPTTAAGGYGVGTLNGASLIVSFGGAPTLDYSVSTTIGGYGFTASKSGLGITGNAFTDNAPNLSGTGCATGCTGRVAFLFTGSAAERAGLSYLIDASTGPGFKVNGVVVFKAP